MTDLNPYHVGIGGFVVVSLYVVIFSFLWRILAAKLAASDNPTLQTIGAAVGGFSLAD